MENKDWLTLTVSLAAVMIAIYGVVERQKATKRIERVRLAEVTDELNELLLRQGSLGHDEYSRTTTYFNFRRELLVQEAASLVSQLKTEISSFVYRALGAAMDNLGELKLADRMLKDAVNMASREGLYWNVLAHKQYAALLYQRGRPDEGADQFQKALARTDVDDEDLLNIRFETYWVWAVTLRDHEGTVSPGAASKLDAAREIAQKVTNHSRREGLLALLEGLEGEPEDGSRDPSMPNT